MWYVIQVVSGEEYSTKELIETLIAREWIEQCFVPLRERNIKFQGSWRLVQEKLFPGYVFIVTDFPEKIFMQLKKITKFTKLLGNTDAGFVPLSKEEVDFIRRFGDEEHVSHLSQVEIQEGNKVKVVSGDLLNYEGQIVKINLHKRIGVVRIEFMGTSVDVHLGIEILEKVEECCTITVER
jgi:transcriptional antiterminator NusG